MYNNIKKQVVDTNDTKNGTIQLILLQVDGYSIATHVFTLPCNLFRMLNDTRDLSTFNGYLYKLIVINYELLSSRTGLIIK